MATAGAVAWVVATVAEVALASEVGPLAVRAQVKAMVADTIVTGAAVSAVEAEAGLLAAACSAAVEM